MKQTVRYLAGALEVIPTCWHGFPCHGIDPTIMTEGHACASPLGARRRRPYIRLRSSVGWGRGWSTSVHDPACAVLRTGQAWDRLRARMNFTGPPDRPLPTVDWES